MPAGPSTDRAAARRADYDEKLGVYTLFVEIPRSEIVFFHLVVESWEDLAVARTMERYSEGDRTRAVVVVLAVPDFIDETLRRLERLMGDAGACRVDAPAALRDALRRDLSEA